MCVSIVFFFQAEDGIRYKLVTGVQTCALPICTPSRPISVLTYRGTADSTVPYAGGKGPSGKITFLGAQGSFQRWAGLDGCSTATSSDGECTYYKTCTAGVEVGLCVKQGGGHAPGDANVGWSFLSRFSLP